MKETKTAGKIKKLRYSSGGGRELVLTLDLGRVNFDDPGQDTPAVVEVFEHRRSRGTATLNCAIGEGEIEGSELTRNECEWLAKQETAANKFLFP